MAYEAADLDFREIDLAGISGRNMAGKSTLIEAFRYALFGRGRYDNGEKALPDKLIREGTGEMEVALTFAVEGHPVHRVIRGRSKSTMLELQVQAGDRWDSLTGATLADTQRLIDKLTGMDDRAFTSTCCFLQGQADKFSSMGSTERKKMLQDLLGLDLYPAMQKGARDRALAKERKAEVADASLGALKDAGLEQARAAAEELPIRKAEHQKRESEVTEAEANLARVEENAESFRQAQRDLVNRQAALNRARAQLAEELRQVEERGKAEAGELVRQATALIDRNARGEREALEGARRRHDLAARRRDDREESLRKIEERLAGGEALVEQAEALPGALANLAEARASEQELSRLQADMAALKTEGGHLREEAALVKDPERIECVDFARAGCMFLRRAKAATEKLPAMEERWKAAHGRAKELEAVTATLWILEENVRKGQKAEQELAHLQQDAARVEALKQEIAQAVADLAAEAEAIAQGESRQKNAAALREQEIAKIQAEASTRLEAAKARALTLGEAAIHGAEAEVDASKRILDVMGEDPSGRVETAKTILREALRAREEASNALGKVQALCEQREALEAKAEALEVERATAQQEGWLWRQLDAALDPKTGIPSEILKTLIPELEAEADHLLQRLTGGSMSLSLPTTVAIKAGERERLEIEVRHHGQLRSYEGLSGGGKFRVDFATRLALSTVLARRQGRAVDCLIIDEGFGSQDHDGRDRLFDCIEAVRGDFGLILVITHIEELLDRLPARFEVASGGPGRGSTVRRTA